MNTPRDPRHSNILRPMPNKKRSIDGFVPAPPFKKTPELEKPLRFSNSRPVQPRVMPRQHEPIAPAIVRTATVPNRPVPKAAFDSKLLPKTHTRKIALGIVIALTIFANAWLAPQSSGQLLMLLYGAVVVTRRIPSHVTFTLSLITIALVPISLLLTGSPSNAASALGTYAFLFLVIGMVTLVLELYSETKSKSRFILWR